MDIVTAPLLFLLHVVKALVWFYVEVVFTPEGPAEVAASAVVLAALALLVVATARQVRADVTA